MDQASLPSLPTWKAREAPTNMDKGLTGPWPWPLAQGEAPRAKKGSGSLIEKSLHIRSMWGGQQLDIGAWITDTSAEEEFGQSNGEGNELNVKGWREHLEGGWWWGAGQV